jgi:hypothetical protein
MSTKLTLRGFTINILNAFQDTYTMLVAFYLGARLFTASYFLIMARIMPMVPGMMLSEMALVSIFLLFFWKHDILV